jgi:uncharacterized protein with HEPN domain
MKPEALKRLVDALLAAEAIQRFTARVDLDDYLNNEILQAAVDCKFEILGEALKKATEAEPSLTTTVPDLRAIISTRNRIIHAYDAVDQLILWDAICNDLNDLRRDLHQLTNQQ